MHDGASCTSDLSVALATAMGIGRYVVVLVDSCFELTLRGRLERLISLYYYNVHTAVSAKNDCLANGVPWAL